MFFSLAIEGNMTRITSSVAPVMGYKVYDHRYYSNMWYGIH